MYHSSFCLVISFWSKYEIWISCFLCDLFVWGQKKHQKWILKTRTELRTISNFIERIQRYIWTNDQGSVSGIFSWYLYVKYREEIRSIVTISPPASARNFWLHSFKDSDWSVTSSSSLSLVEIYKSNTPKH